MKRNQTGFNNVIIVLIIVIIAVLGTVGWLVYKDKHKTNKTTKTTKTTTQSAHLADNAVVYSTPANGTQYLTIKEWSVRGTYANQDTYSYKISDDSKLVTVISKLLGDKEAGCKNFGAGEIRRLTPTDGSAEDGSGPSVQEAAKTSPDNYTHIGNYYYQFVHDQAACGSVVTADAQNEANDAVKAMVKKLETAPKQ